jgi:hypothetical protein
MENSARSFARVFLPLPSANTLVAPWPTKATAGARRQVCAKVTRAIFVMPTLDSALRSLFAVTEMVHLSTAQTVPAGVPFATTSLAGFVMPSSITAQPLQIKE